MRRLVPLLIVLGLVSSGRAEDDDAIRKVEARLEERRADRDQIELEMIRAWEGLANDHVRLGGEDGARLRATLSELVDRMVRDVVREGEAFEDRLARAIRERVNAAGHLSFAVSDLVARRVADIVASDTKVTGLEAAKQALDDVIPLGQSVDRIWDLRFADHPTVIQWRHVNVDVDEAELDLQLARDGLAHGDEAPEGMVFVAGGRFRVGPNDTPGTWLIGMETTAGRESVRGFYIDRHEVTNRAYADFLAARPEEERAALLPNGWAPRAPHFSVEHEHHPVTGVTFAQAWRFAKHHGKRLPTELEWEKAARGPEGRLWPWGDTFDPKKLVWGGGGATGPARILSVRDDRSGYGACDVAGNVAEIVATRADEKRSTLDEPPAGLDQFIVRGGSFDVKAKDEMKTRTTHRGVMRADMHRPDVGFRCALDEKAWRRRR